jgi:GntR family transcriptional regulator
VQDPATDLGRIAAVASADPGRRAEDAPLREDRRPISLQFGELVRKMILTEGFRPGDRLPTEAELAARFELGRGSVREALKLLEQDGLITVQHGRGRFVSAISALEVDRPITKYESLTEMLDARGLEYATEVLSAQATTGDAEETRALKLPTGAPVVRLRRIRRTADRLLVYSVNAFPASFLGDSDLDRTQFAGSVTEWLAARDRRPISSVAQIRATTLPDGVPRPSGDTETHWLLITEECVANDGEPVMYSLDFHRADVFSFHVLRRQ